MTRAIAALALFLSALNLIFTWQSRRLAEAQEKRRVPRLSPILVNGFYQDQTDGTGRNYAFLITVSNPTDANNSIAQADLAITYLTPDRTQMTMIVRANEPQSLVAANDTEQPLALPATVSAHNAVSGWLRFHVPPAMLRDRRIEAYRLVLMDAHGESCDIVSTVLQRRRGDA